MDLHGSKKVVNSCDPIISRANRVTHAVRMVFDWFKAPFSDECNPLRSFRLDIFNANEARREMVSGVL